MFIAFLIYFSIFIIIIALIFLPIFIISIYLIRKYGKKHKITISNNSKGIIYSLIFLSVILLFFIIFELFFTPGFNYTYWNELNYYESFVLISFVVLFLWIITISIYQILKTEKTEPGLKTRISNWHKMGIITCIVITVIIIPSITTYFYPPTYHSIHQKPIGSFNGSEAFNSSFEKVNLTHFIPNTKWEDCKLVVENITTINISKDVNVFLMIQYSNTVKFNIIKGTLKYVVLGVDTDSNDIIDSTDYILIGGLGYLGSQTVYKMTIFFIPTGEVIDDIVFTR